MLTLLQMEVLFGSVIVHVHQMKMKIDKTGITYYMNYL
jgi:hypothetical protein